MRLGKLKDLSSTYESGCDKPLLPRLRSFYTTRLSGWREGVFWSAFTATVVFVLNLTLIIWAVANRSLELEEGIGALKTGDCDTIEKYSEYLHLGINILSTLLLSASNYTQQRLVAPTRAEVDQAHIHGKSLNVGVPSVRNFLHISRARLILYTVLLATSLPLHIFYNSAISTALGAYQYRVILTTPEQLRVGSNPDFAYARDHLTDYERLEPVKCLESYPVEHTMDRADVIVVLEHDTSHEFLNMNFSQVIESGNGGYGSDYSWQCCFPLLEYMNDQCKPCLDWSMNQVDPANWTIFAPHVPGGKVKVSHCLSQPAPPQCNLLMSYYFMAVVIACNLIKAVCMVVVLIRGTRRDTLVTLGDAIASFLEDPDPATAHVLDQFNKRAKQPEPRHSRLYHSMSKARRKWFLGVWVTLLLMMIGGVLCMIFALGPLPVFSLSFFQNIEERNSDVTWKIIEFEGHKTYSHYPVVPMLLLANIPQLALSLLYLLYNSTITSMLLGREWNQIGYKRKGLRVTVPRGEQRSTYYLSMPWKWALPLMAISALLHWFLSQSLYPVMTYGYEISPDGTPVRLKDQTVTSCAYSTGALILVIAALIIATILFVFVAMCRLKPEMPWLPVSSWVVSAACHPPEGDTDAAVKAVQWGVPILPITQEAGIEGLEEDGMRRCCITSWEVESPLKDK